MNIRHTITVMLSVLCLNCAKAQVWLHPNRGQWNKEVLYKVDLNEGNLFLDKNGFTYLLHNVAKGHDGEHHEDEAKKCQILFSHFENVAWKGELREGKQSDNYNNYYYGKDQSLWKSNVHDVQSVSLLNYYEGIDLNVEGKSS